MERQTQLDIKCLQILRAIIYNQIILVDEEDKERNPKKYRKLVHYNGVGIKIKGGGGLQNVLSIIGRVSVGKGCAWTVKVALFGSNRFNNTVTISMIWESINWPCPPSSNFFLGGAWPPPIATPLH